MLLLQRAWVWCLVRKLKSHKPCSVARKNKFNILRTSKNNGSSQDLPQLLRSSEIIWLECKYFHDASQLRFRALSAMLFGIISLSLVTGKVPKQFKSNCFSVTANIASRSVSHWLSYQDQSFPDSFSFLTYALTWFGSSLMVPEIMKSKIKQMKKLLLTSNQCCYSPGQGPLIFPEVSLCSDWPSAFQKS